MRRRGKLGASRCEPYLLGHHISLFRLHQAEQDLRLPGSWLRLRGLLSHGHRLWLLLLLRLELGLGLRLSGWRLWGSIGMHQLDRGPILLGWVLLGSWKLLRTCVCTTLSPACNHCQAVFMDAAVQLRP